MYGRILAKNASAQMVETLDQSCTSEGLLNDLGRRLSAQFVKGYAVGIGDVNNGLSFPALQRLRDILVHSVTYGQKDDIGLDGFRQFLGDDLGSEDRKSTRLNSSH